MGRFGGVLVFSSRARAVVSHERALDALRAEAIVGDITAEGDATLDALAVAAADDGDSDAMAQLVDVLFVARFPKALIRRYVLTDDEAAEDVLQEALADLPGVVARYSGMGPFRRYFSGVVVNNAKEFLRRRPTESDIEVESVQESGTSWMASRADFERALAELPSEQREVLVLREVEGLSYQQIAERLNVPINTVRSRLNRARRLVASLMALSGNSRRD